MESAARKHRREVKERSAIVAMLSNEVAEQRTGYASRSASMNTRLSVLVAAASLATGMQVDLTAPHPWFVVGTCLAALAAILGVVALWPQSGGENGIEQLQRELWNHSPAMAAYILMHRQLEILREDEKRLLMRAWCARFGYLALALSIVAVALQVTLTK